MGKAADQRRKKRMEFFNTLAKNEPVRFEKEWEKRLFSWLEIINRDAGRLRDNKNMYVPPVFDKVDNAMEILEYCGKDVYGKYASHRPPVKPNQSEI